MSATWELPAEEPSYPPLCLLVGSFCSTGDVKGQGEKRGFGATTDEGILAFSKSMLSSNESMKLMLLLKQFLVTGTDTQRTTLRTGWLPR